MSVVERLSSTGGSVLASPKSAGASMFSAGGGRPAGKCGEYGSVEPAVRGGSANVRVDGPTGRPGCAAHGFRHSSSASVQKSGATARVGIVVGRGGGGGCCDGRGEVFERKGE